MYKEKSVIFLEKISAEKFIRGMIYPPYPAARYKGHVIETFKKLEDLKSV